jgi:hypothetical protein
MMMIEVPLRNMPVIPAIGSVQYVAWAKLKDVYLLFPNGARVAIKKAGAIVDSCIVAIADSPEIAWQKAVSNKSLMEDFGVTP